MDHNTISDLLSVGGNALVLWVACVALVKALKGQYEARITALEKASEACENDRIELHKRFEAFLIAKIKNPEKSE